MISLLEKLNINSDEFLESSQMCDIKIGEYENFELRPLKTVLDHIFKEKRKANQIDKKLRYLGRIDYSCPKKDYKFTVYCKRINNQRNLLVQIMIDGSDSSKNNQKLNNFSKIAHEFKTPLLSLISLSEEIRSILEESSTISEKLRDKLELMEDLSNYSLFLVNDIINMFNESGNLKKEKVKMTEVLKFCYKIMRTLLSNNQNKRENIKPYLLIDPNVENVYVYTDEFRLKQILLNLISNAVKFTKGGEIKLEAKLEGMNNEVLKILVYDTGIGIREADLEKIFDDYCMIEWDLKMNLYGSGLGLPISKKISEQLEMNLQCQSKYGKGSVFFLEIQNDNFSRKELNDTCDGGARSFIKENSRGTIVESLDVDSLLQEQSKSQAYTNPLIQLVPSIKSSDSSISNITTKKEFEIDNDLLNLVEKFKSEEQLKMNDENRSKNFSDLCVTRHVNFSKFRHNDKKFTPIIDNFDNNYSRNNCIKILPKSYEQSPSTVIFPESSKNNHFLNRSILIIDDNTLILRSYETQIKKILRRCCINNIKIIRGSDGIDLLKLITEDQKNGNPTIQCTFIDEHLDFMDGSEAIKIIRNLQNLNKIKPAFICRVSGELNSTIIHKDPTDEDISIPKPASEEEIESALKISGIIN